MPPLAKWLAPLAAFAAAAALTALAAAVLIGGGDGGPEPPAPAAPPPAATPRAAPATPDATPATGAAPTPPAASPAPPTPADGAALSGASASPAASPAAEEAAPTLTPDYPDLLVSAVASRDNRLVVVVANEGSADAAGPIAVSVDGGEAQRIDAGKALRPGATLERVLDGEYVQRRASVTVTLVAEGMREENAGNNTFHGVVAPDVPNDLEVLGIGIDPDGGHPYVEVRNLSPIPLAGEVTIAVRAAAPDDRLLLRERFALDAGAGAIQRFGLEALGGSEAESLRVILSTDAIGDADSANNTWPPPP